MSWRRGVAVVEHSIHHPEGEGSSPTTAISTKIMNIRSFSMSSHSSKNNLNVAICPLCMLINAMLSVICCRYAECRNVVSMTGVVMLNVIIPSVLYLTFFMISVVILSVVMLSVSAFSFCILSVIL
jgi:hypothetical protein